MATSLQTDLSVAIKWNYQTTDGTDSRTIVDANTISMIDALTNGTAIDQGDLILHGQASVPVATPLSLDLAGTLKDVFGNTITMAKVKGILVNVPYVAGGGTIALTGNWITGLLGHTSASLPIANGGSWLLWNPSLNGITVTGSTRDTITITASSATTVVDYVIIGTSA
jgi:hypothetical protein